MLVLPKGFQIGITICLIVYIYDVANSIFCLQEPVSHWNEHLLQQSFLFVPRMELELSSRALGPWSTLRCQVFSASKWW